jgi:rod shape-determining protein MreC
MARAARFSGRLETVVFGACILLALVASALPTQLQDPVAGSLRRSVVLPLVGLQKSAERWRDAWLESQRKVLQEDTIALQLAEAQALKVENDRLRRIMRLGSRLTYGFIPAEALHTSGRAEDVITTLTLTAGSKAGVAAYSPVVAPEGIVGLVQTVDPRMSIAILYSHPDFRVSAMSADGSAFGIVYPHLDVRPGRLAERYLLELRNVPFRTELKPGTAIFSSGLGGAWPRGVLIGTVLQEVKEQEVWSRTYIVLPAVNPSNLTNVMILTPKRASQGVGNVWADAAVEAALRNIVAAGDSLGREAAMAEASARRAAQDSLRRSGVGDSIRIDSTRFDSLGRPRSDTLVRPRPPAPRVVAPAPVPTTITPPVRRDTARRDTVRRDTVPRDTVRRDTLRRDTLAPVDTLRPRPDSLPPGMP